MSDFERVKSDVFVTIANSFLKDKNLSNKAKGVLAMILSLPDSWDFSIKGMVKITKDGEASLRAAINEMKENSIDIASEYLVMASELVHLKSKMLINIKDDQDDEYEIITMIEDNLKEFNKSIWFINSSLK